MSKRARSVEPPDTPPASRYALARGPHPPLSHRTYELIKERLLDGRYTREERLSVDNLRTEFGVSKQPVMEALRRLAIEGLVEIIPQVGCQVASYTPDEVADFFAIFSSMEAAIAEVAAVRRTEVQLAQLATISQRILRLGGEADLPARAHDYRILNREFHAVIHGMAHSRIMAEMSQRMWDLSDFLITTTQPWPLRAVLDERHADHERIRNALTQRDGSTARREMADHIAHTITPRASQPGMPG